MDLIINSIKQNERLLTILNYGFVTTCKHLRNNLFLIRMTVNSFKKTYVWKLSVMVMIEA